MTTEKMRTLLAAAVLSLLVMPLLCAGPTRAMYPPDGTKPDGSGGYINPGDGVCVIGVAADGTMLVDASITNFRDCTAWTKSTPPVPSIDLKSMTTQAACLVTTDAGNLAYGGKHYKYGWSTSICYDNTNQQGISRFDLDNTTAMCQSKGGTVVTTGKCVAYGWLYRNRKSDASLPFTGTSLYTTKGVQSSDNLGFCYAQMDMTGATYTDRTSCPSAHNNVPPVAVQVCKDSAQATIAACQIVANHAWSLPLGACVDTSKTTSVACTGGTLSWVTLVSAGVAPGGEWNACLSNTAAGCQTQASYDAGLGWTLPDSGAASVTTGVPSSSAVRVCKDSSYGTQPLCEAANAGSATVPGNYYWNPDLSICVDTSKTTTGTSLTCKGAASGGGSLSIVIFSDNNRCIYAYGVKGKLASTVLPVDTLTSVGIGTTVDLTTITTMGDCLADGYSWDNWLPNINRTTKTNADAGYTGLPAGSTIVKLDATTSVAAGGGNFYSNTGAICTKCHTDESRAYIERNKPGYVETSHKLAGDTFGPWQPNFTAAGSAWGLQGVQCAICHSTAKAAQDDLTQVNAAGLPGPTPPALGPPGAGAPKSASGHNNTEEGSHVTTVCFTCHGTAATPSTTNPASVIPVSAGTDFALTAKGLAPIANEFLNSPHALYTGSSTKVDIGDKTKYGSTFVGYICRSTNSVGGGNILTTVYRSGAAGKIPNLDLTANPICTNTGDGTVLSGAATSLGVGAFWVKEGEAVPATGGAPTDTAQGHCMTCHDVHWSLNSTDPEAEPLRRECVTCHSHPAGETSASGARQRDLTRLNHVPGMGTPLENMATAPSEPCEICHMPRSSAGGSPMHLWRINTDPAYHTMGATQANVAPEGTYSTAAWVDLEHACGQCHGAGTVQDAQHAPKPPAQYRTSAQLAPVARGMHRDWYVTYPTTFSTVTNGLNVNVYASVTCNGTCILHYDWDWGDGTTTPDGGATPPAHTYASAGTKSIMLTVTEAGGQAGAATRSVTLYAPVPTPVAGGLGGAGCPSLTFDANMWTASFTDSSTPANAQVVVEWGDGSVERKPVGSPFSHTYRAAGAYLVIQKVIDSALQLALAPGCTVKPGSFTIDGHVYKSDGVTGLGAATITVKSATTGDTVKSVYTAFDGFFSVGSLKPDTYWVVVAKRGFTFPAPGDVGNPVITVGPNSPGNSIKANP